MWIVKQNAIMSFMAMVALVLLLVMAATGSGEVTYDGTALIVNGTRRMLFSGSIHYPRSTPEMWPSLIAQAKRGGLDVIQTYVFWNVHEPIQGQYNFEGRYDLVRFIKEIRNNGLYVSLRIGPFIEAEWKYGGFPFWLHDVPGIVFRSDNEPFKLHMQKFVTMIVNMMKSEGLYASQGGPIIISQIENEYQTVEPFLDKGLLYVHWAASMAVNLQTGVPWMMCKQYDAPDPVINTCNGIRCGETFLGPNSPNKPSLWTENWTSGYQVYGEETQIRSPEGIAFSVALFIAAKRGTFVNYYMYHGGTNFGKFASSYVTTSYYDEAPIDEYGLIRQSLWGHLKELHVATMLCSEPILWGTYYNISFGPLQKAHIFQTNSGKCVAFLVNSDKIDTAVQFWNDKYEVPARSISILPDCKNVVFNTAKVNAQYGVRSTTTVQIFDHAESWGAFRDGVSNFPSASFTAYKLLEQMNTTKDLTDYLWYTISYNNWSTNDQYVLHVSTRAHIVHAYVNDEFIASAHGNHGKPENVVLETPISLKQGQNNISLLSVMVGLPDAGAFLEKKIAGLRNVRIQDIRNKSQDLTNYLWGYQIGLVGERLNIFTQEGSNSTPWTSVGSSIYQPLTWYKTTFDAPLGTDPVAIDLESMAKGEVWVNGESIGRYWVSFKTPQGRPSQSKYHIPRSFLKPWTNLLVIFEETGGNPLQITIDTVSVSRVCSSISEANLPSLLLGTQLPSVRLRCYRGKTINSVEFVSYGTPTGDCSNYAIGSCHSAASSAVVEKACLGRGACTVPVSAAQFGGDPCPGISKTLLVVANCS